MTRYVFYTLLVLLAGCSSGPYLHPESSVGQNAVLYRTCPGPKAAMSFAPLSAELKGVHVLVYVASPAEQNGSTSTELRLFGRLYPSARKADTPLWVSAASPRVTVQMATGNTYQVSIKLLETGFDPRELTSSEDPGTVLGQGDMDDFTLTFPDIFVNGEKVPMAPIHFKKREERYAPVFNC